AGQLPKRLVRTRNASGQYDGGIGFTCLLCHAGRIGEATPERPDLGSRIGIGNITFDIEVFSYDLGKAGGVPIPLPYPHNQGRGTINAVSDFEFLMTLRDFDTLNSSPFVKAFPAHASPGDQDPPAWHNTGSRPRVYMDGGVSADNTPAPVQFLAARRRLRSRRRAARCSATAAARAAMAFTARRTRAACPTRAWSTSPVGSCRGTSFARIRDASMRSRASSAGAGERSGSPTWIIR